ncbi:MAG: helix-turn-helix domain-containing protein [Clostridiales bacterium]|nr:helix-turn-helix domain-containing protein [Clostridiales bacterium]
MKEFLESILHQNIELQDYKAGVKLPLTLSVSFDLYTLSISGQDFLLARPKEEVGLVELRRCYHRLQQLTGQNCALYLKDLKAYPREKMIEEGIAFIWEGHQVYLPFLGYVLKQDEARPLQSYDSVSFLTQKLLLTCLYEAWEDVNATEAARQLNVSKMSITRCLDEIESMKIPVMKKKGKSRLVSCIGSRKEMWERISAYMRNPLLKEYYLENDLASEIAGNTQSTKLYKSGNSALTEYSMLEDNPYQTYAVTKRQIGDLDIKEKRQVPKGEIPGCVVQELGYMIPFSDKMAVDPLTVALLLEKEREDARVDFAIDAMLEEHVW